MLSLYRQVTVQAGRHAAAGWPAALSLVVYALIILPTRTIAMRLGVLGGFLMGFVLAACWSSYLEIISQVVAAGKLRLSWREFRSTFAARLWDVISVMFAFWIIALLTGPLTSGTNGIALSAILGLAMAFFFNVVPELLYQGQSRSFGLLMDSARFMFTYPVLWLLPNILFAAVALGATGELSGVHHPAQLLIAFGNTFSSPAAVGQIFFELPLWALPIALFALHFIMVFRGVLFREIVAGTGSNDRLRAFRAAQRR